MNHPITVADVSDVAEAVSGVAEAVRRGIREADPPSLRPRDWQPLCLALHDRDGTILGGVYGATMWDWLMIDGLWVAESLRGSGYGDRLLREAEILAISRGCRGAWLGTYDFQARSFYERHGYDTFGALPEFPSGHTHYHLAKVFGADSPATP
jgi:GNAT superfamily N-acetyltransferase